MTYKAHQGKLVEHLRIEPTSTYLQNYRICQLTKCAKSDVTLTLSKEFTEFLSPLETGENAAPGFGDQGRHAGCVNETTTPRRQLGHRTEALETRFKR
jgi:hypothetical protein